MPNVLPLVASTSVPGSNVRSLSRLSFSATASEGLLATIVGICGAALSHGAFAGFHDMRGRREIRFAAHQRYQRLTLRLAFAHLRQNGIHRGRLERRNA